MIVKKKSALGAAICLVAILLSVMINPTYSRYVLTGMGTILKTVITSPPISVTFMSDGTEIHKDESLSSGMTLNNLTYSGYTVTTDNGGSVTKNFTNTLTCPECNGSIGSVNGGEYIGCVNDECVDKVMFKGWMNANGDFPTSMTVKRNVILNAKWTIENKYHLYFIDLDGNIVLQKEFESGKVEIDGDDVAVLSNAATQMSNRLTQDADNTMTITAKWGDGTVDYLSPGTPIESASDMTVRMELSFSPKGDASLKLEPKKYDNGDIIDENGDGYPDEYIVSGIDTEGTQQDFMIPDSVLGSPVTEISEGAFSNFDKVRDVYIPNTVTYIGKEAFSDNSYPQMQIFFDGTRAKWDALVAASDENWDDHIGTNSVIVCLRENSAGYYKQTGSNGFLGIGVKVEWTWQSGEYGRGFGEG